MLILTRNLNQSVCIGGTVNVTVSNINARGVILTTTRVVTDKPLGRSFMPFNGAFVRITKECGVQAQQGRGGQVKLAFDAPKHIHIQRDDIKKGLQHAA